MIDSLLHAMEVCYPLTELSAGEYAGLKARGMNFSIRRFHAQGLGSVSVMSAKGFFGLMRMDTLIVNPTELDMPLLSYDRVYAMGNDTLIFEVYDTLLGDASVITMENTKRSRMALPEHDVGSHWYDDLKLPVSLAKKGKKKDTPAFDALTTAYVDAFLQDCRNAAACEPAAKREKASRYVEGLLEHGGPSTDVFMKAIGREKTADLFRRVLFGTRE